MQDLHELQLRTMKDTERMRAHIRAAMKSYKQEITLATLRKEVERLHGEVEALRAEVEAAMPAMQAYAAANPMNDYRGVTQDPNAVHAWLSRNMKTAF